MKTNLEMIKSLQVQNNNFMGWTNKPTYFYSLEVFNDELTYDFFAMRANLLLNRIHKCDAIQVLGREIENYFRTVQENNKTDNNYVTSYFDMWELKKVNFYEIAEELITGIVYSSSKTLH